MAKELPYFKFEPNAWENGNIQMLSREDKGLFIDICSMYWSRLGDLPKKLAVQKLCAGNATALNPLCDDNIIEIIDGNIYIKFLTIQLSEFENTSVTNSKNAKEGWEKRRKQKEISDRNATALNPQSETYAIREEESKEDNKYNTLFEIKDFNFALSNFSGNKQYFYLCYRYWELYRKEYPNHMHLKTAKFKEWYDSIRLMVESDKQSIDRIVAIYIFLTKCQNKEKGYETFLFSQVKSLTALRKKTASGEYRLDNLATLVNEKLQKDDEFNRSVKKAIETFKTKFQ